jgi:leucyl/phenylalanyl-tRNA--protein transferase
MLPYLSEQPVFPTVDRALTEPNGLLAVGGRLDPDWLLAAYRQGIFPWFSPGDPILWWSPDPRMVLIPGKETLSASLRKTLRRGAYEVRCDSAFEAVLRACAAPRHDAAGTWITEEMIQAYCHLHTLGWAHSIETWEHDALIGGLYGVAIGRAFFGESMFHRKTDASKIAFVHLARLLKRENFAILDCQMHTSHLASLGAHEMTRKDYIAEIARQTKEERQACKWSVDFANAKWST